MSESAKPEPASSDDMHKLSKLIMGVSYAMLTTQDLDGKLHSRPMVTRDMDTSTNSVWFLTRQSTSKVKQIGANQRVNIAYSDPKNQTYVSVTGPAEVVRDRSVIEELWNPMYKAWFPNGLDDPEVTAIKVSVEEAEYWDSPSSTVAHLYGYAKAMVTGQPAHPGDHSKIAVST